MSLPRPLGNRVLVRQVKPVDKIGSLYVPQGREEWPPYGEVLALGPRAFEGYGEADRPRVGDKVLIARQPDSALNPDVREGRGEWDDLLMLRDENVVGVLLEDELPS